MREDVRRKCDLFSENKVAIHKSFKWEYDIMSVAAGLLYTCEDRKADIEKMKACADILRKEKSAFSAFRDIASLVVVSKMALSSDPAKYLFDVSRISEKIKGKKVFEDANYILAAANIIDHDRVNDADVITEKAKRIIDGYSQAHPVITSADDMPAATLLALGDKSVENIINETEKSIVIPIIFLSLTAFTITPRIIVFFKSRKYLKKLKILYQIKRLEEQEQFVESIAKRIEKGYQRWSNPNANYSEDEETSEEDKSKFLFEKSESNINDDTTEENDLNKIEEIMRKSGENEE